MTQITLASLPYLTKKKRTRREQFLEEMDKAIPWDDWLRIVERRYRKVDDNGRPKMPAERMLRIYFLQQWFNLSDPAAEEALYDSTSMRLFANRHHNRVRAFGEHPFHVIKCLWHHTKARYRGLFKNTCQLFSLCALTNIFRLRHQLALSYA